MRALHIYHSGFYMEFTHCTMLFDYYEGTLPPLKTDKPLYVFASHVHRDHFSFCVFTKEELRAHPNVFYFLSNDIKRKYNRNFFLRQGVTKEQYERIIFVKAGETVCTEGEEKNPEETDTLSAADGLNKADKRNRLNKADKPDRLYEGKEQDGNALPGFRIRTLHSTDAGVAFLIEVDGRRIFHAGDLNWWSWEGESREDEAEMERAYKDEIKKLEGEHIDLACLPLDGRQKERFALGFDWFMRHVETAHAYPMHYWDDDSVIAGLLSLPCSEPYRNRIVREAELVLQES